MSTQKVSLEKRRLLLTENGMKALSKQDKENGQRLATARAEKGYASAAEFARRIGVPPSTMNAWERGERRPKTDMIHMMATILEIDPNSIMLGRGLPTVRIDQNAIVPDFLGMTKDLPVYGQVAGSLLGKGAIAMNGEMGNVRRPEGLKSVKSAYSVYVIGDSMEPRFRAGDLLFVNPVRPPRPGDAVIIQIQTSEHGEIVAYVKTFVRINDDAVVCQQHNPDCIVQYPKNIVLAVHRILDNNDLFGI